MDGIAIVGLSFKFPGGLETENSFWEALLEKKNTATKFPKDRLSVSGIHHPQLNRRGTVPFTGGHFLTGDIASFDAPFFSISDTEARSLDPQQRGLLETTYRALENAGFPLERVRGTNTSVYTGCFTNDWQQLSLKDAEQCTDHAGIGFEASILANRLSWFFDFKGTSFNVDSACSSSLVCIDLACKALLNKDVDMSIAAGCNLIFYPDIMHALSNLSLLSPNNQSYSFDSRANGYARGEGIGVLVLKRVSDAIRDKDCIRAVIRGSGSGQDGYTTGLTNPSGEAQRQLIKNTYARSGVSMKETRFVEAHGTGTAMGDPIEAKAIGEVFGDCRSPDEPIYVGSLKSNIGHLEGASGIAGVIKAVLVLEKGVIPPNANLVTINPRIDAKSLRLKFPDAAMEWPTTGLRRASVNSFGFGGTNSHIIIDDALHYLKLHGVSGIHNTTKHPSVQSSITHSTLPDPQYPEANGALPQLLAISAKNDNTLRKHAKMHASHVQSRLLEPNELGSSSFMTDFIYTMSTRRTQLSWKACTAVDSVRDLANLDVLLSPAQRVNPEPALCMVFTGQGAQYAGYDLGILDRFDAYSKSLTEAAKHLQRLGCCWDLRNELYKHKDISRINDPQYSQPITTILQVAFVDLLRSFGCYPKIVIGHSSGEIAAAYCKGAISRESAWRISYFRGYLSSTRTDSTDDGGPGAMMAVGLSRESVVTYIQQVQAQNGPDACVLTVACINSPSNVTVSGASTHMDILEAILIDESIFTRRLDIDIAYHSPYMNRVREPYLKYIGGLSSGDLPPHPISMISTVTGKWIGDEVLCTPQYWIDNMVSPVLFSSAIGQLKTQKETQVWKKLEDTERRAKVTFMLEVGFHPALKSAVMETLGEIASKVSFDSTLIRNRPPLQVFFATLVRLYCHGLSLDLQKINSSGTDSSIKPGTVLCNLPEYPFDHTERYWQEGRISKRLRLHGQGKLDLLGKPSPDWNDSEPMWRNFIRVSETPWVQDHRINGTTIYPGAGMLVMALEAAKQTADVDRIIQGYELKDVIFLSSLNIPTTPEGIETHFHLRHVRDPSGTSTSWSEFRLFSFQADEWCENCRGAIRVQYQAHEDALNAELERLEELDNIRNQLNTLKCPNEKRFDSQNLYDCLSRSGFGYGPSFQLLQNCAFNVDNAGRADVNIFEWPRDTYPQPHTIHPCTLDAIMHLSVAAFADGGATEVPTQIPSSLRRLWIAHRGLSSDDSKCLKAMTRLVDKDNRGAECDIFVLDHDESDVQIQMNGLRCTIVAEPLLAESSVHQVCYHLDLKPDVSALSSDDLSRYCAQARVHDNEPVLFFEDLTFLLLAFVQRALHEVRKSDISPSSPHLLKYYQWASTQLCRYQAGQLPVAKPEWIDLLKDEYLVESKCLQVEETNDLGRAYVATGRQLTSMLRGETDALDFFFNSDLLSGLYREVNSDRTCFAELSLLLEACGHKNPDLKVLEVGAGTGGTTEKILSSLTVKENGVISDLRYSAYHYTDISPSFFESARNYFAQYSNIEYRALDIELDPLTQGFERETFDLVVAANTLHATSDINRTLANVRKLMKPGGLLILYEPTRPEILRTGFLMGLLPGWWLGSEPDREWGPTMPCSRWDSLLRNNGFSGNDLELQDFLDADCQEGTIIVSRATSTKTTTPKKSGAASPAENVVLVLNTCSMLQQDMACRLRKILPGHCRSVGIQEATQMDDLSATCLVFLQELEHSCLFHVSEAEYTALRKLFLSAQGTLWVSAGGGAAMQRPEYRIADGFFRVLRHENPEGRYVTLALDMESGVTDKHLESVCDLLKIIDSTSESSTTDMEYVEVDGYLNIPRIVPDRGLSKSLFHQSLPYQTRPRKIQDCPPLQLALGSIGLIDTLHFKEDEEQSKPLEADDIEVEVRAIGLNFRDCLLALGRVPGSTYGSECAGIVSQVGQHCEFSIGDRVAMSSSATFRTHARGKVSQAILIPDSMLFSEAASIPTQFCTAWQAVHELARLRKGESILIHSGAGGTGQAAIQVAQRFGGVVYATVGSRAKKDVLVREYGVPEDHIFYSRDSTFAKGVMRKTGGRGVDVVLNSLAGDSLVASWECIAPYGRFIELGKRDILANAKLPMYSFRKNTSFICFDGFTWQLERPDDMRRTLEQVFRFFADGVFHVAKPMHVFSVEDTELAFQSMQDAKIAGKTVLEVLPETVVKATLATQPSFFIESHAAYVVAGGLGGLGRSIARWLTSRGARNLILLSRSGVQSGASQELVDELGQKGVVVYAPACDVTDSVALERVIRESQTQMPLIKGCIQASMVLRDSTYEQMDYQDWRVGTDCKTLGSWNLHTLLPVDLDFFVMLSSASSVVGLHGQANYAAGNSYMDALARFRVSAGQRAVSLDLGALKDDGLLAETPGFLDRVLGYGALDAISRDYFYAVLDYYCNPGLPLLDPSLSQPIIGLGSGDGKGIDRMAIALQPLFRHVGHGQKTRSAANQLEGERSAWGERFVTATSQREAAHVVAEALIEKLQGRLDSLRGEIDMNKPIGAYGVDSLFGVELRGWFTREFEADVTQFEISGASFSKLSALVAAKSRMRRNHRE